MSSVPEELFEVTVTKDDLAFGRALDKGWYQGLVKKIDAVEKKEKPGEYNRVVDFDILGPADSKGATDGVSVRVFYSNMGFMTKLLSALGMEVKEGVRVNLRALKDQKIDLFIEPKEYQGRINNTVSDYAPLGKMTNFS